MPTDEDPTHEESPEPESPRDEARDADDAEEGGWLDRFPALRRLGALVPRARVPFIAQLTASECGAACLAMVLGYHGRATRLDEVREVMAPGRDGVDAGAILSAGEAFGLRGRGVAIDLDSLEYLDPGTVLHWEFQHFVVFDRLLAEAVDVVDPAVGHRRVPMTEFRKSFTGIALLFEPGEAFTPSRGAGAGPRFGRYLAEVSRHSRLWSRILLTTLMVQLFALAVPMLVSTVVSRVVPRGDYGLLTVLGVGLLGLVFFNALAALVRAHLLLHLRTLVEARMTTAFLDHLVRLPYDYFQRRPAGDLLMRLNSNTTIREILTSGMLSTVLDGTMIGLYAVIIFGSSLSMGVLVLVLAALHATLLAATRRTQRDLMSEQITTQARQQSYQVEMLNGMETLKATGAESRAVAQWSSLLVDALNVTVKRGRVNAWIEALTSTLHLASPLLILGFGAVQVMRGEMTLGGMLGVNSVAGAFLQPLSNLVGTAGQFQLLGSYLDRLNDVFEAAPEQDPTRVRQPGVIRGEITLDQVSFSYSPGSPAVVHDVSVTVGAGQFIAVVGASGSGKSTLMSLMLGLHRPTTGRVLLDGVDLSELRLRAVRQQFGIVTQRPFLFAATIRANIAFQDPAAPLERIEAAARLACIDEEIREMPLGYGTPLSDSGASLSGGERQRIALARALMREPRVLLLDEATSALDALTEARVHRELARLRCTRVVIAHRLSTIRDADVILVIDRGALVEHGTHAQLLARGGHYARLVAEQLSDAPERPPSS